MEGRLTTAETKLSGIEAGANKITIDSSLSSSSTNPVQNKVINTALAGKANASHTHSYLPLSGGTISGNLTVNGTLNNGGSLYTRCIEISATDGQTYIDFHTIGTFGNDYNSRIIANDNNLSFYSGKDSLGETYFVNSHGSGKLVDWVVAEGVANDNWYYRKWASGYGECWNTFQVTTFSLNSTGDGSNKKVLLPFTFKTLQAGVASSNSDSPMEYYGLTNACLRGYNGQSIQVCSETGNTLKGIWIDVYCAGTWK